ncbi:hypothetical protein SSBR45G_27060 [Bradyrhizobium sp. SSBR45G]|uniref:hypothetical protein n=1 Tax=unclassified Bradyrhizobium TaxID=2631580 RepID=UPI002342BC3B|nr:MULTISPECIES: hypothetical protein [unclassified Bradyrhizobium]GLH77798.1 hypothetical protein SSBR45G_27060 [Bradyrhizobium sp. SSBR45G]GLH85581.1 hypothetical protein SSBR45R_30410 [Bradyrhizobium sp. SSBR45R]
MIRSAILGAAVLATALAGPAMARDMHHRHMDHHMAGHDAAMMQQRTDGGWNNDWNRRGTGFWPTDIAVGAVGTAAGIAGAAIGTAGAIATAPFRTADAYAYDPGPYRFSQPGYDRGPNGYYGDWNSYATRNGLVCRPGTVFKGSDGLMHICQ